MFPPNRDPSSAVTAAEGCGWEVRTSSARKGLVSAMPLADALGLDAESEDFQAPMRAAGWHSPRRAPPKGGAARGGSAPSQGIRGHRLWMDPSGKHQPLFRAAALTPTGLPTTDLSLRSSLNRRRTAGSASCRASIRCFTVGKVLASRGGLTKTRLVGDPH